MESKKCSQCGQIQPVSCFDIQSRKRKTGIFVRARSWCKECTKIKACESMRKFRSTPDGLERNRLATQRHREKIGGRAEARARQRVIFDGVEMTHRQRAEIKAQRKKNADQDKQELKQKRKAEREAIRAESLKAKPWNAPGLSGADKFRLRYALDSEFNIKQRLRAAMRRKRQGYKMGDLIRGALNRGGTSAKFEDFVGYSTQQLKTHLEAQFTKDMNWERFRLGEIHIDHIVPISSFNLSDPDELKSAWAITNLRPLWAKDNLMKSSKRIYLI
jgi:hypothetical protein